MGKLTMRHPTLASGALLLALLLALAAPDHWGILAAYAAGPAQASPTHAHGHEEAPDDGQDASQHTQHCHESAATCSDVPLGSASGLAFLAEWLAFGLFGAVFVVRLSALAVLAGRRTGVETPPPRPLFQPALS